MSKVVEYILRVKDEASGNVDRTAAAAEDLAGELSQVEAEAKQATAAVSKLSGSGGAASAALQATGAAGQTAAQGLKSTTQTSISATRAAGALAQQLPDVVSQLAAGANPMQVFAQQGLQVVQQLNAATVASKAFSAVASPLGLALAALAAAVVVVANETADARREMGEYKDLLNDTDGATRRLVQSQNALKLASGDVAGFIGDLQIQTALLEGTISDADIRAGELGGSLADALRPQLLDAGRALAEARMELDKLEEGFRSGNVAAGDLEAFTKRREALRAAIPVLESNVDAIKALGTEGRQAISAYAAAMDAAEDSGDKLSKTLDKVAESAEKVAAIDLGSPAALAAAGLQAPRTTDVLDADAVERSFAQALSGTRAQSAMQMLFMQGAQGAGRAGGALSAAGAAAMSPGQALAGAGPIGAGLATLAAIGQAGTDRIVQQLADFGTAIVDGFVMLPELFGRLLAELPVAIGEAVAAAIRDLLTPGGSGFQPFKGRLTVREILGIGSLGMTELTGLGKAADVAFGGNQGFAAGDTRFISRTGMAIVHQGEQIIRANGGTSAGIMGGGSSSGGPGVILNVGVLTNDVLKQTADEIGRDFDPNGWGRGTRPVYGG